MPSDTRTMPAGSPRGSPGFLAASIVLGLALLALCVWLARQEYFFGDDVIFLRRAQLPRNWREVFLPFGQRGWWSYRPLSIEVFFSVLYKVARLDAFPYLLASVVAHFAAGVIVYRLAVQLEIDRRVALITALLSVAMYPSMNGELFWVSAFQTVSGCFLYLLTLTLFIDFLRGRQRRYQVAASAAMVLALLCNELSMTLPGPIVLVALYFSHGRAVTRLRAALLASAPMLVILAAYLPFRYLLIGASLLPTPALNLPHLGWHIAGNVLVFLRMLTKLSGAMQIAALAIVAAGWLVAAYTGTGAVPMLARRCLLFGGWLLCAMVPFLGAYFVAHRAAIVLEAPFCLLLAAHLDPIARAASTLRTRRLVEVGLIALVIAAFPYEVTGEQARLPRGAVNRDLIEILESEAGGLPQGACVRLRTRPDDSWAPNDIYTLGFRTSAILAVAYPGRHLELPSQPGQPQVWRSDCVDLVEIELLHGPEGSRPSFRLRRAERTSG